MKIKHLAALLMAVLPLSALAQAERSPDAPPNTVWWSVLLGVLPFVVLAVLISFFLRRFWKPQLKRSQDYIKRHTQHMERVEQSLERVANALEKKN
jgi:hypothetical protein